MKKFRALLLPGIDSCVIQLSCKSDPVTAGQDEKSRVFTPGNKMNNYCDEDWFGRPVKMGQKKAKKVETNCLICDIL